MKFYCEMKSEIELPPKYTFPQAFNCLNKVKNSFYILEDDKFGFLQCAGEKLKCCIEYRDLKNNKQYRLAKGDINAKSDQIEMSNGNVKIRADEVMTIDDAIKIFKYFYENKKILDGYRINHLDENYYSKSAQQVDAPEPAIMVSPALQTPQRPAR